jgi:hypothetical protein
MEILDETVEVTELVSSSIKKSPAARLRRAGGRGRLPALPADSGLLVSRVGETLSVEIRPSWKKSWNWLLYALGVLFLGVGLAGLCGLAGAWGRIEDLNAVGYAVLALVPTSWGVILCLVARQRATRCWRVSASPRELVVERLGFMCGGSTRIPVDRLQRLEATRPAVRNILEEDARAEGKCFSTPGPRFILACSDETEVRFGEDLSDVELDWLEGALLRAVTSGGARNVGAPQEEGGVEGWRRALAARARRRRPA